MLPRSSSSCCLSKFLEIVLRPFYSAVIFSVDISRELRCQSIRFCYFLTNIRKCDPDILMLTDHSLYLWEILISLIMLHVFILKPKYI